MTLNKFLSMLACFAWIALSATTTLIVTTSRAEAQTACPNHSVSTTHPVWRYAYNVAERNLGGAATCTNSAAIPTDGIRVFSSRNDCKIGRFLFKRESGGGANPTSMNCPNCASHGGDVARIAPGTSASVTAFFSFPDGATARYTATLTVRSPMHWLFDEISFVNIFLIDLGARIIV